MTHATTNAEFLPRLMAVTEALDAATQPVETPLRDRLIAAATDLCERDGVEATSAVIAATVDRNLSQPLGSGAPAIDIRGTFGWNRPTSLEARAAEIAWLDRWPRHLFRLAVAGEGSLWRQVPALLLGFSSVVTLTSAFSMLDMGWGSALAGAYLVLAATLGARDFLRREALSPLPLQSHDTMHRWRHWYVSRAYVRQCLGSATPELMRGDAVQIEARIRARSLSIEKESQEGQLQAQRANMATWQAD